MLCLLTYKPSPCSIHILSVAPPLVYKGTPPLSAPDQCEVSISLSLSLSLSHTYTFLIHSTLCSQPEQLYSLVTEKDFVFHLRVKERGIFPPLFSTSSSFPPSIGIGGVGVVVVDVVVVVAMAASCLQATVGYILWITPRMSERRDAAPPRRRHNNPARRRNPPSLVQKRRR